jgi:hypothetical protein
MLSKKPTFAREGGSPADGRRLVVAYLLSFSPAQAELASRQHPEMRSIACALANAPGTGQMWRCSSVTVCPGACLTKSEETQT